MLRPFGGLAPQCSLTVNAAGYAPAGVSPLPQPVLGGFFTDGNGYVVATHASDNSQVTPSNPAHPGETINVYADDIFQVWPEPPVGIPTPSQPVLPPLPGTFNFLLYLQTYPGCGADGITGAPYKCPTNTPPLTTTFLGMATARSGLSR